MIKFEDWQKLEIKVGTIVLAEKVEGLYKLLRLEVDLGEEKPRQILAGLAQFVSEPSELNGLQVPVLVNLEPRNIRGYESHGMILVADSEQPVFLKPISKVAPGTPIA